MRSKNEPRRVCPSRTLKQRSRRHRPNPRSRPRPFSPVRRKFARSPHPNPSRPNWFLPPSAFLTRNPNTNRLRNRSSWPKPLRKRPCVPLPNRRFRPLPILPRLQAAPGSDRRTSSDRLRSPRRQNRNRFPKRFRHRPLLTNPLRQSSLKLKSPFPPPCLLRLPSPQPVQPFRSDRPTPPRFFRLAIVRPDRECRCRCTRVRKARREILLARKARREILLARKAINLDPAAAAVVIVAAAAVAVVEIALDIRTDPVHDHHQCQRVTVVDRVVTVTVMDTVAPVVRIALPPRRRRDQSDRPAKPN